MPIYEYLCDACDNKMEALQKISDEPLKDCPECGEQSLRKLVSAAAFRLKGSGWYETDFKNDNDKQKNLVKSDDKPADKDGNKDKKETGDSDGGKSTDKTSETKSSDNKPGKPKQKKAGTKAVD